ncbi:MAG: coproporphyrinogen III oxidase [Rhodospirillales bacterium]|nr:MAG: coproporphyrinogen III oxidase [Rhodospirillales bacterium]
MSGPPAGGFALYVHWPFCLAKCPYCDFNSHVRDTADDNRWRAALLRELDHAADIEAPGFGPLTSIFFGGGTPSLMAPGTVAAIIELAAARWGLAPEVEITLEANPTSVEAGRQADFRAAGVNRVSLGVQALDDRALQALGRGHSAAEALAAVRLASRLFDRYSFDLIYARPGQTAPQWTAELRRAVAEAGDHLSLYQLTLEPGTAFYARHSRGELNVPDEDKSAMLYEITQNIMEKIGLPGYEISNHAAPGAESRHNLVYWRGGDYVGIGPGAHGRITRDGETVAVARHRAPERWLARVEDDGAGTAAAAPVDPDRRIAEILMMGLRLAEGVSAERFRALVGRDLDDALDAQRLCDLIDAGYMTREPDRLVATPSGRQRLDALLAHLLG